MSSHAEAFCIKSIRSPQNSNVHIPCTPDFDLGAALNSVNPLLDLVFELLTVTDLKSCLEVCASWNERAQREISKRRSPSWFSCYRIASNQQRKSNTIVHSANLHNNDVELAIILYDCYRLKLNKYVCLHNNIAELTRKCVPQYLEEELVPKATDYCMLSVHRVVSYFSDHRSTDEVQYNGSIFDGVCIPKIPSVRTVMFHCNPSKRKEIEEAVQLHVKPNEEAKCLLVFCKTHLHNSLYSLLELIAPKQNPTSMALGGGVIKGTKTFPQMSQKRLYPLKDTVCIVFLKDINSSLENFYAYSCAINGTNLSKEEFDLELTNFKKNVILKRHSLGFRLCCSAKFQETELQSFGEIFPGLPVLGLDAYGEIGWDCFPNAKVYGKEFPEDVSPAKRLKKSKKFPNAENYFSTIVVIVTWD